MGDLDEGRRGPGRVPLLKDAAFLRRLAAIVNAAGMEEIVRAVEAQAPDADREAAMRVAIVRTLAIYHLRAAFELLAGPYGRIEAAGLILSALSAELVGAGGEVQRATRSRAPRDPQADADAAEAAALARLRDAGGPSVAEQVERLFAGGPRPGSDAGEWNVDGA